MHAPAARFTILASRPDGSRFECFRWTRDAASGIARAEREARGMGLHHLVNFRAEPIGEAA